LLLLRASARLIRDVERYGAAREDAISEHDYSASLAAWPSLKPYSQALLSDRGRYDSATSAAELASVFKSTAPIIEALLGSLLSPITERQYSTLGPMIADLRAKHIGGIGLLSELDHILKFGRDLAEHGHEMPVSVIRIACENAFELAPKLAAIFASL